ncbi:hypothetical protein KBD69_02595 [Candidatus Woesebacteria bacterium]|nr:hypothetical protein [Candidatus Woesebacteria bacterium]
MTINIEISKREEIKVWCAGNGRLSKSGGCPKTLPGYPSNDVSMEGFSHALALGTEHERHNGSHTLNIYIPAALAELGRED